MNNYIKYPRTLHLPNSPGLSGDDRIIESLDAFVGRRVIVTEKLDGENTSMYFNHVHARSVDSAHHPSRTWIKRFHDQIKFNIPNECRICGENLYAKHSIFYNSLPTYFLAFSVWFDKICLSWDETLEFCELLGIDVVPVLYDGLWDEAKIKACWTGKSVYGPEQEGYVVRAAAQFSYDDFNKNVVKFVRAGHVQTDEHWMEKIVEPNKLK